MKAIPYAPKVRVRPDRVLNIGSAWIGIESILFSLIKEFDVRTHVAVEFGVDEGYSLAALANYFGEVLGVDHCEGLGHDPEVIFPQLQKTFKASQRRVNARIVGRVRHDSQRDSRLNPHRHGPQLPADVRRWRLGGPARACSVVSRHYELA